MALKFVYKIPYRHADAWPSGCLVQPLGRVRARAKLELKYKFVNL